MTLATTISKRNSFRDAGDRKSNSRRNPDAMFNKAQRRNVAEARASLSQAEYLQAVDDYFADAFWREETAG